MSLLDTINNAWNTIASGLVQTAQDSGLMQDTEQAQTPEPTPYNPDTMKGRYFSDTAPESGDYDFDFNGDIWAMPDSVTYWIPGGAQEPMKDYLSGNISFDDYIAQMRDIAPSLDSGERGSSWEKQFSDDGIKRLDELVVGKKPNGENLTFSGIDDMYAQEAADSANIQQRARLARNYGMKRDKLESANDWDPMKVLEDDVMHEYGNGEDSFAELLSNHNDDKEFWTDVMSGPLAYAFDDYQNPAYYNGSNFSTDKWWEDREKRRGEDNGVYSTRYSDALNQEILDYLTDRYEGTGDEFITVPGMSNRIFSLDEETPVEKREDIYKAYRDDTGTSVYDYIDKGYIPVQDEFYSLLNQTSEEQIAEPKQLSMLMPNTQDNYRLLLEDMQANPQKYNARYQDEEFEAAKNKAKGTGSQSNVVDNKDSKGFDLKSFYLPGASLDITGLAQSLEDASIDSQQGGK